MAKKKQTLEVSMEVLSEKVALLESGNLSLEDSLKIYEDAMQLASDCQKQLFEAETLLKKIEEETAH